MKLTVEDGLRNSFVYHGARCWRIAETSHTFISLGSNGFATSLPHMINHFPINKELSSRACKYEAKTSLPTE